MKSMTVCYDQHALSRPFRRPPDIDAYVGQPATPYIHYERITPKDLVDGLADWWRSCWDDGRPHDDYQHLVTVPRDEYDLDLQRYEGERLEWMPTGGVMRTHTPYDPLTTRVIRGTP